MVAVGNHPVDVQQPRTVCVVRLGHVVDFGRPFVDRPFLGQAADCTVVK